MEKIKQIQIQYSIASYHLVDLCAEIDDELKQMCEDAIRNQHDHWIYGGGYHNVDEEFVESVKVYNKTGIIEHKLVDILKDYILRIKQIYNGHLQEQIKHNKELEIKRKIGQEDRLRKKLENSGVNREI
mgnify:CR=1 FL=1